MRVAVAAAVAVALVVGAILGSYALGITALDRSQHQWCATLVLLTQRPVPPPANPKANPSREDAHRFYVNLVRLRRDFGC